MPAIEVPEAFGAGVNAANSWDQGQNDAKETLAFARQKAKDDQARANFERHGATR